MQLLKKHHLAVFITTIWLSFSVSNSYGLALRSFIVVPIEKNGFIWRLIGLGQNKHLPDALVNEFAYGISAKSTLFLTYPIAFPENSDTRSGNINLLWRQTVWQRDASESTFRLGILAGGRIPTSANTASLTYGNIIPGRGGGKIGLVGLIFHQRHQIDMDAVWTEGTNNSNDARYDVSWQYRIYPAVYPEWELGSQINTVLEYNGRWMNSQQLIHQVTAGLQWVSPHVVLEFGVTQDINGIHATRYLGAVRFHI